MVYFLPCISSMVLEKKLSGNFLTGRPVYPLKYLVNIIDQTFDWPYKKVITRSVTVYGRGVHLATLLSCNF